jgi:serine/threonine-protein kinase
MPGDRGVVFSIQPESGDERSNSQIAVLDLRSSGATTKIVVRGGSDGRYLPTGHLLYVADNSVRAVRFDLDRLEVRGSPVPVLSSVATIGNAASGDFDVADNGTLVYLPQSGPTNIERSLTWVDRQGKEELISAPPKTYLYPRLSPDGTRVAIDVGDQGRDIWVWDLVRGNSTRVTKGGRNRTPVWAVDGQSIFFSSDRDGGAGIYRQRSDGTGAAERLTQGTINQFPVSLSPDGAQLVFHEGAGGAQNSDVMALSLDANLKARALVKTKDGEDNGAISPDGRWLAYQSNESGDWDIYVRPMLDLERGQKVTVSTGGSTQPRWSRDGRELFYLSPRSEMMSVSVRTGATFSSAAPVKLFDASPYFIGGQVNPFFGYDVSKDGRFLMIKPMGGVTSEASTTTNIEVVQNWFEDVKRLLPR